MKYVETARGSIPLDAIGSTLPHEHIFVHDPVVEEGWPVEGWEGEDVMVARAARILDGLKELGIDTVVDLTVPGLGRNIPQIRRVAEATAVNIVVATGFYTPFAPLPPYFSTHGPGRAVDMEDPLPGFFVRDILHGIGDTGVKANMIKVASDEAGITPDVSRIMQAAAIAHQETGASITTHTHAGEFTGRDQQDLFAAAGVPLEHVLIGHSGDSLDLDYLRELMDRGSMIGMDRFGMAGFLADFHLDPVTDEQRMDTVAALVEQGYAEKLTLSQDAVVFMATLPQAYLEKAAPGWGLDHIWRRILPGLRERGVSEEAIRIMTVQNPATLLVGAR